MSQKPTIEMNAVDRLISYIAPGAALKRMSARHVLSQYDAAKPSRLRRSGGDTRSPDQQVQQGATALRALARNLEQNHDIARGALRVLVNNVVGATGIGIEPQPRRKDGTIHEELRPGAARRLPRLGAHAGSHPPPPLEQGPAPGVQDLDARRRVLQPAADGSGCGPRPWNDGAVLARAARSGPGADGLPRSGQGRAAGRRAQRVGPADGLHGAQGVPVRRQLVEAQHRRQARRCRPHVPRRVGRPHRPDARRVGVRQRDHAAGRHQGIRGIGTDRGEGRGVAHGIRQEGLARHAPGGGQRRGARDQLLARA
jgi:hypothetical protein